MRNCKDTEHHSLCVARNIQLLHQFPYLSCKDSLQRDTHLHQLIGQNSQFLKDDFVVLAELDQLENLDPEFEVEGVRIGKDFIAHLHCYAVM